MPLQNNADSDNLILNELYAQLYNNIDNIMNKYNDALNPDHNNTTLRYINEGYDLKEAYALSFMTTFLIMLTLNLEPN